MPPQYKDLRLSAFQVNLEKWTEDFWVLEFPEAWKPLLLDLARQDSQRPLEQTSVPIDGLNRALYALVPDIIAVATRAAHAAPVPWLYTKTPIEPPALDPVIRAWIRATYRNATPESVQAVLERVRPDDLRWQRRAVDLSAKKVSMNGTAEPAPELYRLLPEVLGSRLSQPGLVYEHGSRMLSFRRAPRGSGGVELISWPPEPILGSGEEQWPFSFLLTLTLQTVPFQSFPVVHCDVGVRRWANRKLFLPSGRDASVYLLSSVPWIEGINQSHNFQVAPIRWVPRKEAWRRSNGNGGSGVVWGNSLAPILEQLVYRRPLPSPADIYLNPAAWMNDGQGVTAAVPYHAGLGSSHYVGAGVMPGDRHGFVTWLEGVLAPQLRSVERASRVSYAVARPRTASSPAATESLAGSKLAARRRSTHELQARRRALAQAVQGTLTLDVLYATSDMRELLLSVVAEDLGFIVSPKAIGNNLHRWESPELSLNVRTQPLGASGDYLALDEGVSNAVDRLHRAIQVRRDEVCHKLPPEKAASAALVELGNRDSFAQNSDADPKFAVRLGGAAAGRVVQFISPRRDGESTETTRHRAESAWRDLLRQLGFQGAPPRFAIKGVKLPDPLQYVGVWLIKQWSTSSPSRVSQQVPVAVRLTSNGSAVLATAAGIDGWLPYPDVLRRLAGRRLFEEQRNVPGLVESFVRQVVDDVAALGDALLLTDATNLRGRYGWSWLNNTQLLEDRLGFGAGPVPIGQWPGLRHVRVRARTDSQPETPECYGQMGSRVGLPGAVWRMYGSDRVFGSTGDKPVTARRLSANLSKVNPWASVKGPRDPDARKTAWNPQLVELVVAGVQHGDEPWMYAAIAHELRSAASHHDETIIHPLPLHLAQLMEEYVIPLSEHGADDQS